MLEQQQGQGLLPGVVPRSAGSNRSFTNCLSLQCDASCRNFLQEESKSTLFPVGGGACLQMTQVHYQKACKIEIRKTAEKLVRSKFHSTLTQMFLPVRMSFSQNPPFLILSHMLASFHLHSSHMLLLLKDQLTRVSPLKSRLHAFLRLLSVPCFRCRSKQLPLHFYPVLLLLNKSCHGQVLHTPWFERESM